MQELDSLVKTDGDAGWNFQVCYVRNEKVVQSEGI